MRCPARTVEYVEHHTDAWKDITSEPLKSLKGGLDITRSVR